MREPKSILSCRFHLLPLLAVLLSLVLVACSAPPTTPGAVPAPGPSAGPLPGANELPDVPGLTQGLRFAFRLDSNLQKNFRTQQTVESCAQELTKITTDLELPGTISANQQIIFKSKGITTTTLNGKSTLHFNNTLDEVASTNGLILGYTFENMPAGVARGTTRFANEAGTELGFIKYSASINRGITNIIVELRSNGEESALPECPELMTMLSGGILSETGGGVSAYVPTATPTPSGSASACPPWFPCKTPSPSASGSATPTPSPPPPGPTQVPVQPVPSPAPTVLPIILSISPETGMALSTVTITGNAFRGVTAVRFAGIDAYAYTIVSDSEISAKVPMGFSSGKISLTNAKGSVASEATFIRADALPTGPKTIYVKADGNGTGSSWSDATPDLDKAMYLAQDGDQIWVAAGKYLPGGGSKDRRVTFTLRPNVAVYGGFNGSESDKSQRDLPNNETILSCDLNGNDDYVDTGTADMDDNCLHVVKAADRSTLDSVTLEGGNANSFAPHDRGGGIVVENALINLNNVKIRNNRAFTYGGGIFSGVGGSALMSNSVISNNNSSNYGGGMYNAQGALPELSNVTIALNVSKQGAGVFNEGVSPVFTGVTIQSNTAQFFGGGMYNRKQAAPLIQNSLIDNNTASLGGGLYNTDGAGPILTNVMIKGNDADNGGGIYAYNESAPKLTKVQFINNTAKYTGGGYYLYKLSSLAATLDQVVFSANQAGYGGGLAARSNAAPLVSNSVFVGNQAAAAGGGVYNYNRGNARMRNVTFSNNLAPSGAEMYAGGRSNPVFISCAIWNETLNNVFLVQSGSSLTVQSSAIKNLGQYTHSGFGNLDIDPFFVNAQDADGPDNLFMTADDGLRLATGSPALNYGASSGMPLIDILGVTREAPPEMGAYEGVHEKVLAPLGITDLVEGTGTEAGPNDRVIVAYVGKLTDGRTFDSSYTNNTSLTFVLGQGAVISGWDQGIPGMKVGGRRKLVIPPHLAYGAQSSGIIPPNATLIFEIELLHVGDGVPSGTPSPAAPTPIPDPDPTPTPDP